MSVQKIKDIIEATLLIIALIGSVMFFIIMGLMGALVPFTDDETLNYIGGIWCSVGGVAVIFLILAYAFHYTLNND